MFEREHIHTKWWWWSIFRWLLLLKEIEEEEEENYKFDDKRNIQLNLMFSKKKCEQQCNNNFKMIMVEK